VPEISDDIVVDMAQVKVTQEPNRLVALGVGSCVVITIYDNTLKVGAMAHAMLPDSTKRNSSTKPFTFADLAIDGMIRQMNAVGSIKQNMEAKIVGGANMFPLFGDDALKTGNENVLAAKKKLQQIGIPLVGEAIGGNIGRSAELDTASGILTVRIKI